MDGGSSQLSRVHVWLKLGQLSDGVKLTEINALTVEHVVGVWDRDHSCCFNNVEADVIEYVTHIAKKLTKIHQCMRDVV